MAEKKKRKPAKLARFEKTMAKIDRDLQRAKDDATPLQWARIHDVQARIATARGVKQKMRRGGSASTRSNGPSEA